MKNVIIFGLILMMSIVSVSATDYVTGYSENPIFQSETGWSIPASTSTYDSWLSRSTSPFTDINYNDVSWSRCEYLFGGDEFSPVPIYLADEDSSYEHKTLILTMDDRIVQIDSSCTEIDSYNITTGETIITNIGAIRGGRVNDVYYRPSFSFLARNGSNTTYAYFLTLDEENSTLELTNKLLIGTDDAFGTNSYLFGMTGGCFSSSSSICAYENRVFGFMWDTPITWGFRFFSNNGNTWSTLISDTQTSYAGGSEEGTYTEMVHDNILFFEDMANDGNNEFIIFGKWQYDDTSDNGRIYKTAITPSKSSPYYSVNQDSYQIWSTSLSSGWWYDSLNFNYKPTFTDIWPCQIGSLSSQKEVCYATYSRETNGGNSFYNNRYGWCDTELNSCNQTIYTSSQNTDRPAVTAFTTVPEGNGLTLSNFARTTTVLCAPYSPSPSSPNYTRWECGDGTDPIGTYYFESSVATHSSSYTKPLNVFVTELDGNLATMEILFSNGVAERINWGGTNTVLTDWESTFSNSNNGYIIASDISDDEKNELIYRDDNLLYIYSMDNTPFSFMNFTYEDSISSITTTTLYSTSVDTSTAEEFVSSLNNNISFIIGMILIVGFVVFTAGAGIKNPVVLLFVGLIATVMVALLGLISTAALILIIMVFVIMIILSMTIFKQTND